MPRTNIEILNGVLGQAAISLCLKSPHLRYGDGRLAPTDESGPWKRVDRAHFQYPLPGLDIRAAVQVLDVESPTALISLSAIADDKVSIGLCSLRMETEVEKDPEFLDRFLKWRTLGAPEMLNDNTPFGVRFHSPGCGVWELRADRGCVPCRLWVEKSKLRLEIVLDAAALHPDWKLTASGQMVSAAAPEWKPGRKVELQLLLRRVAESKLRPAFLGRYPAGAEAAFSITDHCDFETEEKLAVFLNGNGNEKGWCGRGLRMTKGVFALSSAPDTKAIAPSLQDSRYASLIRQLHKDGSEIAPHALTETRNVSGLEFQQTMEWFAGNFLPLTWIDHGYKLPYTYSRGAAERGEYDFLGTLRRNGFLAIWSYHDLLLDPSQSLNLLALEKPNWRVMLKRIFEHLLAGELLSAAHYARTMLKRNIFSGGAQCAAEIISDFHTACDNVRSSGKFKWEFFRNLLRNLGRLPLEIVRDLGTRRDDEANPPALPFTRDELASAGSVCYPEPGVPLNQAGDESLMLFDTMEVVHLADAYSPAALQRLLAERGLHIGHCYLLNTLPYLSSVFQKGAPLRLASWWTDFVGELSRLVSAGRVWNPGAGQLAGWLRALQGIRCRPLGSQGMKLENGSRFPVEDVTLFLDPSIAPEGVRWSGAPPRGWRRWEDWLVVWGTVPPGSRTVVSWKEALSRPGEVENTQEEKVSVLS